MQRLRSLSEGTKCYSADQPQEATECRPGRTISPGSPEIKSIWPKAASQRHGRNVCQCRTDAHGLLPWWWTLQRNWRCGRLQRLPGLQQPYCQERQPECDAEAGRMPRANRTGQTGACAYRRQRPASRESGYDCCNCVPELRDYHHASLEERRERPHHLQRVW